MIRGDVYEQPYGLPCLFQSARDGKDLFAKVRPAGHRSFCYIRMQIARVIIAHMVLFPAGTAADTDKNPTHFPLCADH